MRVSGKWLEICRGSRWLAWLTAVNICVWLLLMAVAVVCRLVHLSDGISIWIELPGYFPAFLSRPWTLATYMVVQHDVLHMLFNVLWLYWFGTILLTTLSDRHLASLYIGGGICGGLMFLAGSALGMGGGWLCGSSASVLAVMCGAAVRTPDHRINLFLIGSVRLKWVALVCGLLTLAGGGGTQAAHFGGILWGIASGIMLRNGVDVTRMLQRRRRPAEPRRRAEAVVSAIERSRRDRERLDELLDKIRMSGYDSLSRRERGELQDLSKRLK